MSEKQTELDSGIREDTLFRVLLESAPDGILLVNDDGVIQLVNTRMELMFGYYRDEMVGENVEILVPTKIREAHSRHLDNYFAKRETMSLGNNTRTIMGRKKNGETFPVELSLSPFFQGSSGGAIAVVRDVTERKSYEKKLLQSKLLIQEVINNTTSIIYIKDIRGRYLLVNNRFAQKYGVNAKVAVGSTDADMFDSEFADYQRRTDQQVLRERATLEVEERFRKGDRNLLLLTHKFPLLNDTGKVYAVCGVANDISSRKEYEYKIQKLNDELQHRINDLSRANKKLEQTQSQLVQSEKMASIGQLAAGVAHEINNPVGYINSNLNSLSGYVEDLFKMMKVYDKHALVYEKYPDLKAEVENMKETIDLDFLMEDIDSLVKESLEGAARVKQIVKDLKDFSHVQEAEWQWADLHRGLDSTLNIVWNEIKYKALVYKEYGDIPEVECMPSQVNQVFMNLLVNAAHAIEGKGSIYVRTRATDDDCIQVEIEDTGRGIEQEHLGRIFDPFYTTKPVGKGTGLGLSLSYGIVEKHGGRIDVKSEAGKGATFTVTLPVHRQHSDVGQVHGEE